MSLVFFQEHWAEIVERVRDDRLSMGKKVQEGKPVYFEDNTLLILFERESLLSKESLVIMEDVKHHISKAMRAISRNRAMKAEILFEKQS